MERLFGLGKKVMIQWERGGVSQSRTADVLLRLMDQTPDIVDDYGKFTLNLKALTGWTQVMRLRMII